MSQESVPAYDVFVSHSSKDADVAYDLVERLERDGLKCWIAPRDIRPGEEYGVEIIRGLQRSRRLVLLHSGASRESRHVRAEVERAANLDHPIYWVRLEEIDPGERLEFFLSMNQGIDAFDGRHAEHWDRLSAAIKGAPVPPPRPPHGGGSAYSVARAHDPLRSLSGRLVRIALYTILGWGLLWFDPLGFGSAMSRASERVVYNIAAPFYGAGFLDQSAPTTTKDPPPTQWNRQITVLLLDDAALKPNNWFWPVPPGVHAEIIEDLYRSYRPAAIMIDTLFIDRRPGQEKGLARLRRVLAEIMREGHTRVFLAADSANADQSGILVELRDVAELVPVTWDTPDNHARTPLFYPLAKGAGTGDYRPDPGPAFAIYRHLCNNAKGANRRNLRCPDAEDFGRHFRSPMQVYWGVQAPGLNWEQSNLGERFNCRSVSRTLLGRISAFLEYGITGTSKEFPQACPYAQLIRVRDFADKRFRALNDVKSAYREALGRAPSGPPKIVFYGADLRGLQDSVSTYTHGTVPGVYMHAMALDNLLTLGDRYVRYGDESWEQILVNCLLAFGVALVSVLVTDLRFYALAAENEESRLGRWIGALSQSRFNDVIVALINFIAVGPFIFFAVYASFVWLHLSPANWVGFLGITGLIRIVEARSIEKAALRIIRDIRHKRR